MTALTPPRILTGKKSINIATPDNTTLSKAPVGNPVDNKVMARDTIKVLKNPIVNRGNTSLDESKYVSKWQIIVPATSEGNRPIRLPSIIILSKIFTISITPKPADVIAPSITIGKPIIELPIAPPNNP